jgi:UPF0716 protein FxsA
MLAPLVLLFIVVPIAELAVIIQVGEAIGVWWTIGLLVADSVLGSLLMRAQGRAAWRALTTAIRAGRPPAREALDGALVVFGGALLITPGFISDILGLLLLLPPTRALVRRVLVRRLLTGGRRRRRPVGGRERPADVDGTAVELDPTALRPPRRA